MGIEDRLKMLKKENTAADGDKEDEEAFKKWTMIKDGFT